METEYIVFYRGEYIKRLDLTEIFRDNSDSEYDETNLALPKMKDTPKLQ